MRCGVYKGEQQRVRQAGLIWSIFGELEYKSELLGLYHAC